MKGSLRRRGLALALTCAAACSAPPAPDYGPPGGLRGKAFDDDAGAAGPTPVACTPDAVVDAGACAVSWRARVFPLLRGKSCMGCHATTKPVFADDPDRTYDDLRDRVRLEKVGGLSYVNPCATDPERSGILGNLRGDGKYAVTKMPPPPAALVSDADLRDGEAWVRCGAPRN